MLSPSISGIKGAAISSKTDLPAIGFAFRRGGRGKRPELQGGGLVRSAGGETAGLLGRKTEEREKGDARILGSGDFVSTILSDSADTDLKNRTRISLDLLGKQIASQFEVEDADLKSSNKKRSVVDAKAVFGYLAIKKMGYSGREVGTFLNMRSYSAIRRPARFA